MGEMVRRGCRVALGLDGLALDEDDDALREMRLAYLLHQGTGFEVALSRDATLAAAVTHGRMAVLGRDDGQAIATGAPADLLLLDWDRIDEDRLRDDLDPLSLLFARANGSHVDELWVSGRRIVTEGVVQGVDEAALTDLLRNQMRTAVRNDRIYAAALGSLEAVMAQTADHWPTCCG